MTYDENQIKDADILNRVEWATIKSLRELTNISLIYDFRENIFTFRDKIDEIFSNTKSIVSKTTRFPDDGIYCFLNHPDLRDNLSKMLLVAKDNDLRYTDSIALRKELLETINELSKIVYSLSDVTLTNNGCYNRKTFEAEFGLTWWDDNVNDKVNDD